MMKAKAEAEAKEMQAQGMKRGEDFLDCKWSFSDLHGRYEIGIPFCTVAR